ncbi:MAG: hypothetical protein NPIRA02_31580 [Nitrospirales bacterium]|nr:MAG: hypothetical protein NPIRA02_31580 [Nitrospirales bacterium]
MSLRYMKNLKALRFLQAVSRYFVHGFILSCMMLGVASAHESIVSLSQSQGSSTVDSPANPKLKTFQISPGPLDVALTSFAREGGIHLAYDSTIIEGRDSQGVSGRLLLDDALTQLLDGTGLSHHPNQTGIIRVVERLEVAMPDERDNLERDMVDAQNFDKTASPPRIKLSEVVVRESRETGYGAVAASTATKTDTPIKETPVSIQVVPRQVIEDQAAQRLQDVYKNVSGVVESGNTLNAQSEVLPFIRGFEAPTVLRNGLRATLVGSVDLVNIQSVEVLKGPASILFGALEPWGGVELYDETTT